MSRPVVLVVALPYVGATALAGLVEQRGGYDVVVPDFGAGDGAPSIHFDAVLSTLPVPEYSAPVVIVLPSSWDRPLRLTVDEVTADLEIKGPAPLNEVLDLLDHHLSATRLRHGRPSPSSR